MTAISIQDVHQTFRVGFWMRPVEVLKGVSFEIPRHSVCGLLGANGAGKTTLIHSMVGLRRPTRGLVSIKGVDAASPQSRQSVGYMPERPYFHEHLTGEALLRFAGTLARMAPEQVQKRIPVVLERVGIQGASKRELKRYSKGMLQRIGIAQAILHDPEILVFDEPMSGLDPLGRREILDLFLQFARDGKTVFFTSHAVADVEAICDHLVIMQEGKVLAAGPIESVLGHERTGSEILIQEKNGDRKRIRVEADGNLNQTVADLLQENAQILSINRFSGAIEALFKQTR